MNRGALPLLYSFRRCPYAMRARLALAVSEQACRIREVDLRDRPEALREVSPKATVPVLVLEEGTVLEESREIMLWTLNRSDPDGWLPPAEQLDEVNDLLDACDGEFKFHLDRYKYTSRYEGEESHAHREKASCFLETLDARLVESAYLFADRATLADMAIAPFVRQFALADRAWFDAQSWSALRRWLDRFLDSELFARVMRKRQPWQPGEEEPVEDWPGETT